MSNFQNISFFFDILKVHYTVEHTDERKKKS